MYMGICTVPLIWYCCHIAKKEVLVLYIIPVIQQIFTRKKRKEGRKEEKRRDEMRKRGGERERERGGERERKGIKRERSSWTIMAQLAITSLIHDSYIT